MRNQNGYKLTELRIKRFFLEILLAVEYLHTNNIIHRDIKPSNIFLSGKEYRIQLGDFGIACQSAFGKTHVEDVGTLLYQSPESIQGVTMEQAGYDNRTDIWSLGVVLFQLCEGGSPFTANVEQRLIYKVRNSKHLPINNQNYGQDLCNVYDACMNKDYKMRPTAKQLLSLKEVQEWAKEVGIVSPQINYINRKRQLETLEDFVEATKASIIQSQVGSRAQTAVTRPQDRLEPPKPNSHQPLRMSNQEQKIKYQESQMSRFLNSDVTMNEKTTNATDTPKPSCNNKGRNNLQGQVVYGRTFTEIVPPRTQNKARKYIVEGLKRME